MRIEQPLDPSQGQAAAQQYRVVSPAAVTVRRVYGIGQATVGEEAPKVADSPPDDGVTLDLSPEGREAARRAAQQEGADKRARAKQAEQPAAGGGSVEEWREQEQRLRELAERDRAVRSHEQAVRAMAGSQAVRSATYSYQVGPDGRLYVVDGELSFDTSEVPGDPEATLRKAEQLQRATAGTGQASPEDRAAAALAAAMAAKARQQLVQEQKNQG
ncbi:MAG TPA: putative metalloprotease CJM1_0395 family protein [Myxococcales bacterium]|nr:putative metalloprotease CJM1_0395 family protein [Myxococcales bacterium]